MRLLITGVTGFVGRSICAETVRRNFPVRGAVRSPCKLPVGVEQKVVGLIDGHTDWRAVLAGVEVVIHLAARAHVMKDRAANPLTEFRKVNVDGTLNLARQAVDAGVRRFIFISSVKVNGEGTLLGHPYTAEDQPAPVDAYGISKLEAEDGLLQLASETAMEVVIIRPPLIYGPGVKANFQSMMHWLNKGIPLPLGAIHNQRSLIALDNLIDLIVTCIAHPAAANQIFMAGDGEDLSTTELLQRMAAALGKKAWLIPVPELVLVWGARLLGKQAMAQRLCGSLQVDISKARDLLDWNPPVKVDEALRKTAHYYLEFHK